MAEIYFVMSITSFVRAAHQLRFNFQQMVNRHLFPQMQVAFPSSYMEQSKVAESSEGSIFDDFLWFAAPKSKVIVYWNTCYLSRFSYLVFR